MPRTVIGLFDERDNAQRAVDQMVDIGIPRDQISIVVSKEGGYHEETGSEAGAGALEGAGWGAAIGGVGGLLLGLAAFAIPGLGPFVAAGPIVATLTGAGVGAAAGGLIGALTGAGVPEDEAHHYAEGVRRGGILVYATTSDEVAERAADIMTRNGAVDIDRRATYWKQQGYNRFEEKKPVYKREEIAAERKTIGEKHPDMMRFPVMEEELKVGKREVEGGVVRVRTYKTEKPVEVPVSLHEEKVVVERNKVDRPVNPEEMRTFKEGTMEFREKSEEAVVSKQAHVTEEVVVGKESHDRTETVRDTVTKTDVDVDRGGHSDFDREFRNNFETHHKNRGMRYEDMQPAYRFGSETGGNPRYKGKKWNEIEPEVRRDWESKNPGKSWNEYGPAVQSGYEVVIVRQPGRANMM